MAKLIDSKHSEITHTIELTDAEVNIIEKALNTCTWPYLIHKKELRQFFVALKDGSATIRLR